MRLSSATGLFLSLSPLPPHPLDPPGARRQRSGSGSPARAGRALRALRADRTDRTDRAGRASRAGRAGHGGRGAAKAGNSTYRCIERRLSVAEAALWSRVLAPHLGPPPTTPLRAYAGGQFLVSAAKVRARSNPTPSPKPRPQP